MKSHLVLDPLHPFLGATPDGVISCDCCGNGVVEIKCPYCCKQKDLITVAVEDSGLFLYEDEEGAVELKQSHQYYKCR